MYIYYIYLKASFLANVYRSHWDQYGSTPYHRTTIKSPTFNSIIRLPQTHLRPSMSWSPCGATAVLGPQRPVGPRQRTVMCWLRKEMRERRVHMENVGAWLPTVYPDFPLWKATEFEDGNRMDQMIEPQNDRRSMLKTNHWSVLVLYPSVSMFNDIFATSLCIFCPKSMDLSMFRTWWRAWHQAVTGSASLDEFQLVIWCHSQHVSLWAWKDCLAYRNA
jgi:hypothetical protein